MKPKYYKFFPVILFFSAFLLQSCKTFAPFDSSESKNNMKNIIPRPFYIEETGGFFTFSGQPVTISNRELENIGNYLGEIINSPVKFNQEENSNAILLTIDKNDMSLGSEGYVLKISGDKLELTAYKPEGLFRGVQTIRQLIPAEINTASGQNSEWKIPTGIIRDHPRFEWRGTMLDVARHFFSVEDVKKYIDALAYYKINRFHIHLSDDQGWRIEIKSWPRLTEIGSTSSVNNEKPGFYTQEEYSGIVKYAQDRFITIIPEIDMPSHTNALLASYPEFNCSDNKPSLYSGTDVGFSSLCTSNENIYKIIDDIIREISALTPGDYFHVGGDEAASTDSAEYISFIERVQDIVNAHGKKMIGWEEIAQTKLKNTSVAQLWRNRLAADAVKQGAKVIVSPAEKIYIDMKYDSTTVLGLHWAGYVEVKDAYDWEPTSIVKGVKEQDILGVEAPLWSETLVKLEDIYYMAFPRLIGVAEMGWTKPEKRNWDEYKIRLGSHGKRLSSMGINFYKSPQVEWK